MTASPTAIAPLALCLAACGTPYVAGQPHGDAALTQQLIQDVARLYPPSFRMHHRVLLTVAGREMDFSGYVLVNRAWGARVIAMGDMGGTLFEVLVPRHGAAQVVRSAPGFDPDWLRQGVGGAVRLLYLETPTEQAQLARARSGQGVLLLSWAPEPGKIVQVGLRGQRPSVHNYLQAEEETCIWRAEVVESSTVGPWEPEVPSRIKVTHLAGGYSIEIAVLKLEPVDLPHRFFAAWPGGTDPQPD